jgi:hypothetical protein
MENLHYILMADIIDSRKHDQKTLITDFKDVVSVVNTQEAGNLISPLTITLGDEFQGVLTDLESAIQVILNIEEVILSKELNFKLRYTLIEGKIDTEINREIAYEMLGEGLTIARDRLQQLKHEKNRFSIGLRNTKLANAINNAFLAFQGLVDNWTGLNDMQIASMFLNGIDYKQIAIEVNREKSVIWKRKKSLKIDEYLAMKNVLYYLAVL